MYPSILGYDPVSIGKHFSNKLISRRHVVVGKPCSLFYFLSGGLKKNMRFPELEMYDKISLYRFPHISYGNGRINKRTISPGARWNVYFCKSCNNVFNHKRREEKILSFNAALSC